MSELESIPALTCPYTSATVTPQYVPGVGWIARGAYDPCAWQDELELMRKLRRGRGRGDLKCAYTGVFAAIERSGGHARAVGPLCPGQVWTKRAHLIYDLSQRPGKRPKFERDPVEPKIVVGDVRRPESDPSEGFNQRSSAYVDQVVEKIVG